MGAKKRAAKTRVRSGSQRTHGASKTAPLRNGTGAEGPRRRQRAEQALRESDALLRAFYDSPGALRGVVEVLEDDILVVSTNTAQAAAYGRTPDGVRDTRASELGVPRSVIDLWRAKLRESQETHASVTFEYSSQFRSASSWGSATVSALAIQREGRPLFGYVALDITERKRTELLKEAMLSLGTKLSAVNTPVEAARAILAAADTLWKWDAATLDVCAPNPNQVQPILACDIIDGQRREVPSSLTAEPPTPRMRRVMQEGPALILRGQPDGQMPPSVMFGDVTRQSASILCVPLRREGHPVGVLSIQSYTPKAYTEEDLRTLQALADHCGGALERIWAEAALRESQERLRMALEAAGMVTWEWDVPARTIRYSDNVPAIAHGEAIAPYCSLEGLMQKVHPEDRARLSQVLDRTLTQNTPFKCDYRVRMLDGAYRWILGMGQPEALEGGRPKRVLGVSLDITDRKHAEEALREARDKLEQRVQERTAELQMANASLRTSESLLRSAFDNVPFEFWMRDLQGVCIMENAALRAHWGDLLNKRPEDSTVSPEALAIWQANNRRAYAGEVVQGEIELHEEGGKRWMHNVIAPFRVQGEIQGIFGFNIDITERKRAEESLRETTAALQALSRRLLEVQELERRTLAAELHDELGQQLTCLRLALETGTTEAEGKPDLAKVRSLLNDLISRIRNLSLTLRPSMLDDLGLLPALLWQIKRFAEQTRIRVEFTQNDLPGRRFGQAVETAAYRVVQEALTNVARHAGVNEVTVHVEAADESLRIQIQDTGRGFDAVAALASRQSTGLRGMQERCSLLGGKLAISSDPGAGTFILAVLPFASPPASSPL